jgi:hypothetical protein
LDHQYTEGDSANKKYEEMDMPKKLKEAVFIPARYITVGTLLMTQTG